MSISAKECKTLRKKLRTAEKKLSNLQQDITVDNTKIYGGGKACFMLEEYDPWHDKGCEIDRDDFVPSHSLYECDSFYNCKEQQCRYFARYQEYKSAEKETECLQELLDSVPLLTRFKSLFAKEK